MPPAGIRAAAVAGMLAGAAATLEAQAVSARFESWRPPVEAPWLATVPPLATHSARTHGHTMTGLLIGGLVGAVATGVFLGAFCSDPDTHCGVDEVARATAFIALPAAAVGALVGTLVRTRAGP